MPFRAVPLRTLLHSANTLSKSNVSIRRNIMILKNLLKVIFGCLGIVFLTDVIQIYGQRSACKPFDFNLAADYQTGSNAFSFASADFNADGFTDVTVINAEVRTVSVLFGDGAGGFAPARTFPSEINPYSITSGDLNSDGKFDLIVGSFYENKIAVLFNEGQGVFSAPNITVPPNSFGQFYDLKTADFNGDGNLDLAAVANQQGKQLKFFLGNGQGGLTLASSLSLLGDDTKIAVGNLNGDNLPDVVASTGSSFVPRSISYVFSQANGNFALTYGFSIMDKPASVKIADLDNDGKNDFLVAFEDITTPTQPYIQPFLGDGGGAFAAGTKVELVYFLTPSDVAVGYFNADGKLDLAAPVAGNMVMVTYGVGNATYQNPGYWAVPSGSNLIFAKDLNQDNKQDLAVLQTAYAPTNSISVLLNDGADRFNAPKPVVWGTHEIEAADFNNDGFKDFVSAYRTDFYGSEVVIALNDMNGGLLPDQNFATPAGLKAMKVGDFNGDGNFDAVTAHAGNTARQLAVYFGNGTGAVGMPISTSLNVRFLNLIVGKFNADGKDDVFAVDEIGRGYSFLSSGNGTFTLAPNFPVTLPSSLLRLEKGDFNRDGKTDLIISNNAEIRLWLGDGAGQFTQSASAIPALGNVVVGDFNADGNLDLSGAADGGVKAVLGDGTGAFGQTFLQAQIGSISSLIAADFNSDGFDDLAYSVILNNNKNLIIVPSGGQTPAWLPPTSYSVGGLNGYSPSLLDADFNGDNKPDIAYNAENSRGVIYNISGQKPCVSINDVTVTEDDGGTSNAMFTVTLSAPSSQIVRLNYTLQGQSATIGTDLQNASGRLEIPAGQTSATINVPITGDLIDEFDETFTVNLSSPANASIVDSIGAGTITDNDAEPSLTVADVSKVEGASFQHVFQVNLSAPSGKPISFRYATANGTAVVGSDYLAVDTTRNVAPGTTTIDVNVGVSGDSTFEPDENFFLNFSNPTNVTLSDNQAQGTIVNDDNVPTVSIFSAGATEGDMGQFTFPVTVSLSNPTYLPVTVNFVTSDGTALAGSDYVANNSSITVAPEQQSATLNVQIIGDTINEPNELFNINIFNPVNAGIGNPQTLFQIFDDEFVANDYDRDGKTDFAVFRPSDGTWYRLFSSNNSFAGTQYGASGDFPASGDYNGDGRTDITVWRPSNGVWYSTVPNRTQTWGTTGDTPVHGDYDNDGRIDLAVFRPGTGTWYIQQSFNNVPKYVQFGLSTDIPVPADYDGDGKTDVAVFRPDTGIWYVLRSRDGAVSSSQFGIATDKLVPADYDGDGRADIAVFRDGIWYVLRSSDGGAAFVRWGQAGDKPVPGNYDGDGKTDYAVYRSGVWYVLLSSNGSVLTKQFGASDDIPVASVSNN